MLINNSIDDYGKTPGEVLSAVGIEEGDVAKCWPLQGLPMTHKVWVLKLESSEPSGRITLDPRLAITLSAGGEHIGKTTGSICRLLRS